MVNWNGETRTIKICPEVMFGFLTGFIEVLHGKDGKCRTRRYYRNPTQSSIERAYRVALTGERYRVGLYDQTWFMVVADVPRGDSDE